MKKVLTIAGSDSSGGAGVSTTGSTIVPSIEPIVSGPAHPGSGSAHTRRFLLVLPFTVIHVLVPSHPAATSYHSPTLMSFAPSTDTRGSGPLPRFTKKLNFFYLLWSFITLHISYGWGSLVGLLSLPFIKK